VVVVSGGGGATVVVVVEVVVVVDVVVVVEDVVVVVDDVVVVGGTVVVVVVVVFTTGFVVVVGLTYLNPNLFSGREGFQATLSAASNYSAGAGGNSAAGPVRESVVKNASEAVPTPSSGPADFGYAEQPAGCYPRDQLTPSELLPKDSNSVWAQQNPMGNGSLKGKNFFFTRNISG
jgi:hypothetical protein